MPFPPRTKTQWSSSHITVSHAPSSNLPNRPVFRPEKLTTNPPLNVCFVQASPAKSEKPSLATAPPSWQGQLSLTFTVESVSTAEITRNNQPASASVPAQHKRGFYSVRMIKPESQSMHIPPHPLNNQPSRQKGLSAPPCYTAQTRYYFLHTE